MHSLSFHKQKKNAFEFLLFNFLAKKKIRTRNCTWLSFDFFHAKLSFEENRNVIVNVLLGKEKEKKRKKITPIFRTDSQTFKEQRVSTSLVEIPIICIHTASNFVFLPLGKVKKKNIWGPPKKKYLYYVTACIQCF